MRQQRAALLLMLGIAFHANARSYATVDPWGNSIASKCEWGNMPEGCNRNRFVNPRAEQTFYTAPPGTPSTMAPLDTTSKARETRFETPQTKFEAPVSTSSPPTGILTPSSTIETGTISSSIFNCTSTTLKTTSSPSMTTSTTFKATSSTGSTLSTTSSTASSPPPPPPPPPPKDDPFQISLKHCSGARTDDALHCTGACRDVAMTCDDASKGCLVNPETPAECIETDGKQLIDVCDRHKKVGWFLLGIFGLGHDAGDGSCHGLDEWTSIGIRDDGTHVYNTPKTKRIRVWPNIHGIEVKDWA